jgi:hypothetical protein
VFSLFLSDQPAGPVLSMEMEQRSSPYPYLHLPCQQAAGPAKTLPDKNKQGPQALFTLILAVFCAFAGFTGTSREKNICRRTGGKANRW